MPNRRDVDGVSESLTVEQLLAAVPAVADLQLVQESPDELPLSHCGIRYYWSFRKCRRVLRCPNCWTECEPHDFRGPTRDCWNAFDPPFAYLDTDNRLVQLVGRNLRRVSERLVR